MSWGEAALTLAFNVGAWELGKSLGRRLRWRVERGRGLRFPNGIPRAEAGRVG